MSVFDDEIMFDGRTLQAWIDELALQHEWNIRHALALYAVLGVPRNMLDVGCGDGAMVKVSRGIGINAIGIDQLVMPEWGSAFVRVNLVNKYSVPGVKFQLVLCLEVAEHLDPSAHATLCDTLTENLAEGGGNYLVFSSAHPGQGGSGHLSERPATYWQNEFFLRRMNFRQDLTCHLQLAWVNLRSPLWWLASNVMVFEK